MKWLRRRLCRKRTADAGIEVAPLRLAMRPRFQLKNNDNLSVDPTKVAATDRARIDQKFDTQDAFYRTIVEGAADVTTILTPDGTILFASASIGDATSLGYAPSEVVGRNTLELVHPDDRQRVAEAIADDLAGHPTIVEGRARRRDGSWMWVEMRGKAIAGVDGKTIVVAYSRNIEERKRLQYRLEQSEEYFKSLLHGSSDLITVLDQSGTLRFVSDSVTRILGYTPDEVLGKKALSFVHKDDLARAMEQCNGAAESSGLLVEVRIRTKSGRWCPCEGSGRMIADPDGHPMLLINTRDISERRRVDREHALLAAIVESSDDAIVSNSLDQRIMTWNKGAERLFGYTADEAIGQRASLYMPPEWRTWGEVFLSELKNRLDTVQSFEVPCLCKDGRRIDVWTVCGGIRDRDGRLIGISAIHRDLTQRKRADCEQALLAALVRSSEDAIISLSTDLRISSWNRGAQRLLGYTAEETIGRRPFDLYFSPENRNSVRAQLAQDLELIRKDPEATRQSEVPMIRKDGTQIEVTALGSGIYDANGKLVGMSRILRDVTERNRVERENAALAAIVESSDDAINFIGTDLRITYWNRGAERMFGYTAAEAIGQPITLHIPAERHTHAHQVTSMLTKHPDEVARFEGPNRRKDGTIVVVSTVCFAVRDRLGNVVGLSAIQRDLTEQRRAERKTAMLAAIVNASQDAIISVTPDSKIVFWNPAAERVYGHTADEAIGKDVEVFLSPEERSESVSRVRYVVQTGEPVTWEQTARGADGKMFTSEVSIFPLRDDTGAITSVAGIGRDITPVKESERQLVAAREAALAASRAKSEFLSSMSHEIRTPMTAILGMAELLTESPLSPEQRRYIEILDNNGRTLLDLINSILDLAKIESGRLTLERVAFDLGEVVGKSAQTLAIRAHAKGLDLIVSLAPDVPTLLVGDPLRLRQVLINLIGNAIKFTERGEVLVAVERASAPSEPLRLKFTVRDTGIGIAKDKLPALFAAFSQADSSMARKFGGSGLGLAIVKRLVTLMRGEVAIESELGRGCTFGFVAPFELQTNAAAPRAWPNLTSLPVLVVAGNRTEREVLCGMFTVRGAAVSDADSYQSAAAAVRQAASAGRPPRILLLDDRMVSPSPGAIEQLIAAASDCNVSPIAMIRCDNLAADISRLKSLNIETYLVKPIDAGEVARAVRKVLGTDNVDLSERRRTSDKTRPPPIVERPLKILFADDSTDNRTLIRAFLKKTPYRIDEVENGRQAIDAFVAAGDYDLVLMDIQMPEVDGYAATRSIREWERQNKRPRTPIVALTASVFSEAVRMTRAAGCDAHVGKPINKATLLRAIYDVIQAASKVR